MRIFGLLTPLFMIIGCDENARHEAVSHITTIDQINIVGEVPVEVRSTGFSVCVVGDHRPCLTGDPAACSKGEEICLWNGRWSSCVGVVAPSPEIRDGLDNDCDGHTDEVLRPALFGSCRDATVERECDTGLNWPCDHGIQLCVALVPDIWSICTPNSNVPGAFCEQD